MKKKPLTDRGGVIRLYIKGYSLSTIQNLTGWPAEESSKIVKEEGLFNEHRQRDYYKEQTKIKRTN